MNDKTYEQLHVSSRLTGLQLALKTWRKMFHLMKANTVLNKNKIFQFLN
jgi:hypothetical protein